jgi:hypothetical protein
MPTTLRLTPRDAMVELYHQLAVALSFAVPILWLVAWWLVIRAALRGDLW